MPYFRFRLVPQAFALAIGFMAAVCGSASAGDSVQDSLVHLLNQRSMAAGEIPLAWQRVQAFYRQRNFEPAWRDASARAEIIEMLAQSDAEGLSPRDYRVSELKLSSGVTSQATARLDILLTDALLSYAHDLRFGRVSPADVDPDVDLPAQRFDLVRGIASAMDKGRLEDFLAGLPPSNPQYARLRLALAAYRSMASGTAWPYMPADTSIRFDRGADPRFSTLAARLRGEGDASASERDPKSLYDSVMRFQRLHGLSTDGVVGPATTKALNVSAAGRVAQIEANMERWRWLPRSMEPRRLEINVPDATLQAWQDGAVVLASRIIVGNKDNPTPILKTVARGVTVNPPWDVPATIARREILPEVARDRSYLRDHHMSLVDGQVRQAPGPDNALGQLKLEMPNRFSVYLHDTPARTLFAQTSRDLSHGCMRVEKILPLASFAVAGDPEKMVGQLQQAIALGTTQQISLQSPLPVYVLYWTAWVDPDGTMEFRNDLYGRDERLISLLKGRATGMRYAMANTSCPPACSS